MTRRGANGDAAVDVAIVGAGITGLSIAFHLLEAGVKRVAIFERSGVGAEASGVQPGGVRRQWATAVNCVLAGEAVAFYRDVGTRLGVRNPPVLEPCGYVFVAHEEQTLARLHAEVALQRELGIPSQILEPDAVVDIVPAFEADGARGASYCPEDGYFDRPQSVVEAFAEAALREGARIEHADVRAVVHDGDGWRLRLADESSVVAERVVVAAGTGTARLFEPLGVDVPIVAEPKFLFYSEPIGERLLEPLVVAVDRHFAAKQLASGRVLASDLAAKGSTDSQPQWRRHIRSCIEAMLPQLTYVTFPLLVEGFYDMTPDRQAIVAPASDDGALWIAAGFSGHGFMLAPAIGRIVTEALVEGRRDPLLNDLALSRFDRDALEAESRVV
jgi:sarcosine oxidase subunit beta